MKEKMMAKREVERRETFTKLFTIIPYSRNCDYDYIVFISFC